jgi:hypothetical protein
MSVSARRLQRANKGASSGDLSLPRVPWEGGPAYWSQFGKALAAGWTDPSFFPISVFYGKADPYHVTQLKDAGINLYMAVEYSPGIFPLSNITGQGMFAMPGGEWSAADVGNDPNAVAWFISDECDMGYGGCADIDRNGDGTIDQYDGLIAQQSWAADRRALHDGRFLHANFGNGILRTFWSTATMPQHVQLMDSASADKYTYTSPGVADIIDGVHDAPDWPNGVPVPRAYSYGWQADQMKRFQDPAHLRPIWTFIESAQPYISEPGAREILPDEIEGAVWSALIHEARGIAYFQHNNGTVNCTANYSIVECPAVHSKVKQINAKVKSLAPVLNTQSYYNEQIVHNGTTFYRYNFNNDTDTMLKALHGYAYIFAGIGMGHATGSKTFTLPPGISGTSVEVVGESRTLSAVQNPTYSKTFNCIGAAQTWTVPNGVTSITVDMYGAEGGRSYSAGSGIVAGLGGRVQATLSVTPGETLQLNVGGFPVSSGGWNGGGTVESGNNSGHGGGASDIRRGGTTLADRVLVAAGGGGSSDNASGGNGGGFNGSAGAGDDGGGGGTQAAGGAASNGAGTGQLGAGGSSPPNGGGGGGGYYGGGGGGWYHGGGGGGSSYAGAGTADVTHTAGARQGDGQITITTTQIPAEFFSFTDTFQYEYTHHVYKVLI